MIYSFTPILKPTIWGGTRLAALKHSLPTAPGAPIGESWEISGLPGALSVVARGPEAGLTIADLCRIHGQNLLGKAVPAPPDGSPFHFPILIKIIDAARDLSVQVHPNDSLARARGHKFGKNEMWYILDATPGATLYAGFKPGVSRNDYLHAVKKHTITNLLRSHTVSPGDTFFLPAGTVHSIGAGILLAEIQQPSDITYRIFDFNRRDDAGNLRPLHTDLATDAIDFSNSYSGKLTLPDHQPGAPASPHSHIIPSCPHFNVSLLSLPSTPHNHPPFSLPLATGCSFTALICVQGTATLTSPQHSDSFILTTGDTILIGADIRSAFLSTLPGASFLSVTIPA